METSIETKSVSSWDAFAKLKIVAQIVEMSTNIVVGDAVVRVMSLVSQVTAILRRQCRSDNISFFLKCGIDSNSILC